MEKLVSVITMHHVIHKMASVTVQQFSATLVKHATVHAQMEVLVANALHSVTAQRNTAVITRLANVSAKQTTQDVTLFQIGRPLSQVNSVKRSFKL